MSVVSCLWEVWDQSSSQSPPKWTSHCLCTWHLQTAQPESITHILITWLFTMTVNMNLRCTGIMQKKDQMVYMWLPSKGETSHCKDWWVETEGCWLDLSPCSAKDNCKNMRKASKLSNEEHFAFHLILYFVRKVELSALFSVLFNFVLLLNHNGGTLPLKHESP